MIYKYQSKIINKKNKKDKMQVERIQKMKALKNLRIVLLIVVVALVSLISFGGIYYESKGTMKNRIPDYSLSSNLKGYRHVTLVTNDTSDENTTDENSTDENAVNETSETTNEASEKSTNETNEVANETSSNSNKADQYKKSAKIFKNRLKSLDVDNYSVSCDKNTGKIVIDLPEDTKTDTILSDLVEIGKFSIVDSETKEELLNNDDVKSVKFGQSSSSGTTNFVMGIEFNSKGTRKLAKITKTYQNTTDENSTSAENSTDENATDDNIIGHNNETSENETTENSTEDSNATNETSDSTSSDEKSNRQVTIKIDDSELLTTSFSSIIDNGVLTLTIGSATDADSRNSAMNIGAIIENDPLPISYTIDGNTYVATEVENNEIKMLIYAEIIIALVVALVIIAKYRGQGILQVIISVGFVAIILITIRCANVVISLDGIMAILVSYLMNSAFAFMICKVIENKELNQKERAIEINNTLKKYCLIVTPELIISIICLFSSWSAIFSAGMIIFWGVAISLIYNYIVTKFLYRKEKVEKAKK